LGGRNRIMRIWDHKYILSNTKYWSLFSKNTLQHFIFKVFGDQTDINSFKMLAIKLTSFKELSIQSIRAEVGSISKIYFI